MPLAQTMPRPEIRSQSKNEGTAQVRSRKAMLGWASGMSPKKNANGDRMTAAAR